MGEFCGLLGGSEMSQASESKSSLSADIEIFIVYRFSLATRDEKTSCAWDFKLCERTKMRKTLATRGMFAVSKGEEMQDCMSWTQVKLKLDSSSPSSPHVSLSHAVLHLFNRVHHRFQPEKSIFLFGITKTQCDSEDKQRCSLVLCADGASLKAF
jgi:hypothetical protein